MSRVGNRPIKVPKGVEVAIKGSEVTVKGPKGQLSRSFPEEMSIMLKDGVLTVSRPTDNRRHRSMHGFTRSILANMVEGVSQGFKKSLELTGVGYRAAKAGEKLVLQVGYTKPIEFTPPPGISISTEGPTQISVLGIDKELVGGVAAKIRAMKPPDSYLGKGIKYAGERVRRKAGKAGKVGRKK
jgi:large subunit ribosomal protein L6